MLNHFGKYLFILIIIVFFLNGCSGKQENTGLKQLFDLNWKFYLGDPVSAFEVDFNDSKWRNLDLPHDWSSDVKLDQKNVTDSEKDTLLSEAGWYRKRFYLPSEWRNRHVTICFESVNSETKVYLNNNLLGENNSRSDSLHFDLTPHLRYNKKNIIAVRVNSSQQKDGRWLKGTGISRHIWLLVTDPV